MVSVGCHRIGRCKVRRIGNPSILTCLENLVDPKWGRIVSGLRCRSGFETRICFASSSGRKMAQAIVGIEDCVSWKSGKPTNIEITFSWWLIAGFGEPGRGPMHNSSSSWGVWSSVCSTLSVFELID